MKFKLFLFLVSILVVTINFSCNNFLNVEPKGELSEEQVNTVENTEKLINAVYASLGNDHWIVPYTSMWVYGSVRSDDSYKGGLGTADQGEYTQFEVFSTMREDQSRINLLWERLFIGVQRANLALKKINNFSSSDYAEKTKRIAEMRFLRGHSYFLLKEVYKYVPYIDESISTDSVKYISNRKYSNDELWDKIAEDFQFGVDNLPESQEEIGRPNKFVAEAYLAKVRLYQAYEQDENNNVININKERMKEVVSLANDVISSGKYGLFDDYAKNYLWTFENGKESI